jgi:homoserine kinase
MESVTVRVNSSSANVGPGFDIFAVATDAFSESLTVRRAKETGKKVVLRFNGEYVDPEANTAGYAAMRMMDELDIGDNIEIETSKRIPPGKGLGSSAASSAASVFAINSLLDLNLPDSDLVRYSMIGDSVASGSAHADNVSASLLGGFVLVSNSKSIRIHRIPANLDLFFLIIIPDISIDRKTMKARQIIPDSISLEKHVENMQYFASVLYGLMKGDRESLANGLNDQIVERSRLTIYPYLDDLRRISILNNSIGSFLSGAGPSVAVVCDDLTDMNGLKSGIDNIMRKYGLDCYTLKCAAAGGIKIE